MAKRNALYAVVLVAVAVVVLLALTFVSFFPSNQQQQQTSNTSSGSNASSASFQVLRTNMTIPYGAGCMVLEQLGNTCPPVTVNPQTSNSSLRGVELISYQGTNYYAGTFSKGPIGNGSYFNGESTVMYPRVWFTNSTVFCVTPARGSFAACPVSASLPAVSW